VAVTSRYYLPTVAVAALAGMLFSGLLRRFAATLVILDALSAGLFAVVGVEQAPLYDLPYVSAIFVGVSAAVGGGLLVDLIAGRLPYIGCACAGIACRRGRGLRDAGLLLQARLDARRS
jgi:uncharacterized membrane protein YeiH